MSLKIPKIIKKTKENELKMGMRVNSIELDQVRQSHLSPSQFAGWARLGRHKHGHELATQAKIANECGLDMGNTFPIIFT